MSKFKVKFTDNNVITEKALIKKFSQATKLKVMDVYVLTDCAFVSVNSSYDDSIKVLNSQATKANLSDVNLRVNLPNGSNSVNHLTIIANKIRPFLVNCSNQEVANEFNDNNEAQCSKAFVITRRSYTEGQTKSIKRVMKSESDVNTVLNEGFSLFEAFIPPSNLSKEDPINFSQCFKCFQLNHFASQCQANQQLCSKCAGKHHYLQCKQPNKLYCLLCKGAHSSVDKACPIRKTAIQTLLENKRKELNEKFAIATPETPTTQRRSDSTMKNQNHQASNNTSSKTYSSLLAPSKATVEAQAKVTPPTTTTSSETQTETMQDNPSEQVTPWETTLHIASKFAEIKAKGDEWTYLHTMNKFLNYYNKTPLPLSPLFEGESNKSVTETDDSLESEEEEIDVTLIEQDQDTPVTQEDKEEVQQEIDNEPQVTAKEQDVTEEGQEVSEEEQEETEDELEKTMKNYKNLKKKQR